MCETTDAVVVRVELPGVTAGEVEVALAAGALHVSGTKKSRAPRGRVTHLCSERGYGKFCRTVPLHSGTVRLPKLADRRGAEFR